MAEKIVLITKYYRTVLPIYLYNEYSSFDPLMIKRLLKLNADRRSRPSAARTNLGSQKSRISVDASYVITSTADDVRRTCTLLASHKGNDVTVWVNKDETVTKSTETRLRLPALAAGPLL
jgi:hypothetical protein